MKFKFFGSLLGFAWSMISGLTVALLSLMDGNIALKAKPWWFIVFAVVMTAITSCTLMVSMAEAAHELDIKPKKSSYR